MFLNFFLTYLQFLSETRVFYEFLILWCWFYNVLVISNFELYDVNFIGFLPKFDLSYT
jgi:hypothetical protein